MKSEKLIPVLSETELRVGMIVVVKGCQNCGGWHRGMIASGMRREGFDMLGRRSASRWTLAPEPMCGKSWWALGNTAKDGRLFRVDDGRADESLQESKRLNDIEWAKARAQVRERSR